MDRKEIIEYITDTLKADVIDEGENISFIWENMEFFVDFKNNCITTSRWNITFPIDRMKICFAIFMDNIEYYKDFGILDKEAYIDQIWLRTGW